jgi:hypothetical protein
MARSDPESAVAGLEEFFGQAERSGRWLPSCAHVYAIGSAAAPSEERREGLAARAVALLEISLQERGDLPWLRSSHEFDSLRSREDFQRLLARVAERGRGRATDR